MTSTFPVAGKNRIEYNEQDFRLVQLILDIAGNLKLSVIAEGVETERQMTMLKNAGCDYVQGYYFSRPLPSEEFEKLIAKENHKEDCQRRVNPVPLTI